MKNLKKVLKEILDWIWFILGTSCEIRSKAVDDGLCDLSGQGRDKYGK